LVIEHVNRLALLVPPAPTCRERVLTLACNDQQRKKLEALLATGQVVEVGGTGGTYGTGFAFTVSSFKVAPGNKSP
jgi:hypothetical protein